MSRHDEAGSGAGAETTSTVLWPPSNGETGGQSNRQGQHRLYLWPHCFGFMWTPSKAPILSQPTLRSLSPYNLWQSSSLSLLPVLLFGWTAESRGELVLPLKMTPVPLHFLPRHCVLHGLCRGESLCSVWPRLLQYLNMMMAVSWAEYQQHKRSPVCSPPEPDGVQSTQREAADGRTENKDVSSNHIFIIVNVLAVLVGANVFYHSNFLGLFGNAVYCHNIKRTHFYLIIIMLYLKLSRFSVKGSRFNYIFFTLIHDNYFNLNIKKKHEARHYGSIAPLD